MPAYLVTYRYTDDSAGRDVHRPAHKRFLAELGERGINRASGPFSADEEPGAVLLITAASREQAIAVTAEDPFRRSGLVAAITAREWVPMTGPVAPRLADAS